MVRHVTHAGPSQTSDDLDVVPRASTGRRFARVRVGYPWRGEGGRAVVTLPKMRARVRRGLSDPVRWTEAVQLVKTAVAAVAAWVLADRVFALPQAFLAPWAALLVVHATVYRTFSRGVRQVSAAVLGVLLAWAVGNALGLSTVAVSVLLVAGLLLGALRWFRDESTSVAATGLIVLTTGLSGHDTVLLDRLFDTALGILVGLAVNLVVWPPLRDVSAARAIDAVDDRVGRLLCDIAEDLDRHRDAAVEGWEDRARDLDDALEHAAALVRQARESSRLNPRPAAAGVRQGAVFEAILRDNEQAVAETRSMARTVGHSIEDHVEWDPRFRGPWLALLREAGEAILAPDPVRLGDVRTALGQLAEDLSTADLPTRHWPEYGALIMNLRNVVTSMRRVADQNPVVVPRYERRRDRLHRRGAGSVRG
jgi:Aromatic acid exporter family member 1